MGELSDKLRRRILALAEARRADGTFDQKYDPSHWENWGRVLTLAAASHSERTGHRRFFIGANFLDCEECGRHGNTNHFGGPAGLTVRERCGHWTVRHSPPEPARAEDF